MKKSQTEHVVISDAELKKRIDAFQDKKKILDEKVLEGTNTIEGLMELLATRSFPNGYSQKIYEKIEGIADREKNPIILWEYLKEAPRLKVYLPDELINHISNLPAQLIASVSKKYIPEWFLFLLEHPEKVPSGCIDLFEKRADLLKGEIGINYDPNCSRTVEQSHKK